VDEELKRKAYLEGMKLKKAGMDNEIIYARLEKQGFPDELIKTVLQNMSIQQRREIVEEQKPFYYSGLIKAGLGVLLAIISYLIFPNIVIIPVGLIITGIIFALVNRAK
jgi:VIT1/CCC1 family predicted Fe2+/Mn2+ transporter